MQRIRFVLFVANASSGTRWLRDLLACGWRLTYAESRNGLSEEVLMSLLLGAALAVSIHAQVPVATTTDRGRGRYLYRACPALDRVSAMPAGAKADAEDAAWAHECSGYIDGWLDALLDGSGALQQRGVCPHEWTVPQLAHIYVVYVERHKDMMNMESGVALQMALKEKFPCARK